MNRRSAALFLWETFGTALSFSSISRLFGSANYVYKRMRKSIKNLRNESAFRAFQNYLRRIQVLENKEIISIYHYDESGLNLNPSVLRKWQKKGEKPEVLPAERKGKISVAGFVNRSCDFSGFWFEGAFDSGCFIACVDAFCEQISKPTVVILDNASFHKSATVKVRLAGWRAQNLRLVYLPPYSPELNLAEHIWKQLKYCWLPIHAYKCTETLKTEVDTVFKNIGSRYRISFA